MDKRKAAGKPDIHRDAVIYGPVQIDGSVSIGARTVIWQFSSVIRRARIGTDCNIATCSIVDGSRIGDRCIVSHGAFIDPGIEIGNDVFVGPCVQLCNDAWPRVDKDRFSMDDLISGAFVTTIIEDGASIGAGVTVLPGVRIGAGAMIAAGAVVTRSVGPGQLYTRAGAAVAFDNRLNARMRRAPS